MLGEIIIAIIPSIEIFIGEYNTSNRKIQILISGVSKRASLRVIFINSIAFVLT